MSVSRAKGDKAACDRMFSQIVRARGRCEMPGCSRIDVVTAHIIGRRFSSTRTNELNAWALCPTHHYEVDNWPDAKMWLVEETIGLRIYQELRDAAEAVTVRFDWSAERLRLKALFDRLAA